MIAPPTTMQRFLFFHALLYFDSCVSNKILYAIRVIQFGLKIGIVVERVVKAWSIIILKYLNISFSDAAMPYMSSMGCPSGSALSSPRWIVSPHWISERPMMLQIRFVLL